MILTIQLSNNLGQALNFELRGDQVDQLINELKALPLNNLSDAIFKMKEQLPDDSDSKVIPIIPGLVYKGPEKQ